MIDIVSAIKEHREKRKRRKECKQYLMLKRDARRKFQVTEYGGDIWITYDGELVCPLYMMNGGDAKSVLSEMRRAWVDRSMKRNKLTFLADE